MLDYALDFLRDFGVFGLFIATALEASSLPFPGALFILIYGYLMQVSTWQLVLISFVNSVIFMIFSLIPFMIGYKLEGFSKRKFDKEKVEKAQDWFRRYGDWSIALSRPLSIGNYISYISGVSRIAPWRFALFTFIGAFPWNTFLLFVGRTSSLAKIQEYLDLMKESGYYIIGGIVVILLVWYLLKRKKQKQSTSTMN